MTNWKVPHSEPSIGGDDYEAVIGCLQSGWLTSGGPKTKAFEREFAEYVGALEAVSLNSCASALLLALLANDIRGEVILPSLTHHATANAVMLAGATPRFVDVDDATLEVTAEILSAEINSKTEAIIVVHVAGLPCDMLPIMHLATKHGLLVIEDSAECIGGTVGGRRTGSFGIGCFSFFTTKNLATGEGGMLVTEYPPLAKMARCWSDHGYCKTLGHERNPFWKREACLFGYNMRMSNLTAALGLSQLGRVDDFNRIRRQRAGEYRTRLTMRGLDVWTHAEPEGREHVYQMFLIRVPAEYRDSVVLSLRDKGIEATVHFDPPVHHHAAYYMGAETPSLPITERAALELVTLPMFPGMTYNQVGLVVESLAESLTEAGCGL